LYYKEKEPEEEDVWLINLIHEIWQSFPFYGYRKIRAVLKLEYGLLVNNKKVLRLMRLVGIKSLYPKPNLSKGKRDHQKYPYLLENVMIKEINHVWMVDITYLKIGTRFVYLVALIDVYSRYIVGWNISFELDTENCLDAFKKALKSGTPAIVNSDQGCQFTSEEWIAELTKFYVRISMDGKGRCKDNIYIERFWRTIKYEAYYLNEYESFEELYSGIKNYINFYNDKRPHQSLEYKTPKMLYENENRKTRGNLLQLNFGANCLDNKTISEFNNYSL
jgi:putative transposase